MRTRHTAYLTQYVPQLAMAVLKQVGPSRARARQLGGSGYDVGGLLKGGLLSGKGGGGKKD